MVAVRLPPQPAIRPGVSVDISHRPLGLPTFALVKFSPLTLPPEPALINAVSNRSVPVNADPSAPQNVGGFADPCKLMMSVPDPLSEPFCVNGVCSFRHVLKLFATLFTASALLLRPE